MNMPPILRENRGPVAVFTLNRPDRRNALSRELMARLRDAIDQISSDHRVRAIVLTGTAPAFCSGMDLKEAAAMDAAGDVQEQTIATLQEFADLLQRLHTLPKPTVAALNGDALAGGAGLMTACDIAIAAESARIGYPEVRRGLVPAIVIHDLTRQLGDRRARALLLGGDPIDSATALAWGLVNAVTAPDQCLDVAIRVAESLAHGAPGALATTKKLLDEAAARPHDLRGAAAISAAARLSDEAREGILAFTEKRAPAWTPPKSQE